MVAPRANLSVDNFEMRVLRASLRVIHLASATASAIERSARALAAQPAEVRVGFRRDVNGTELAIRPQYDSGDVLLCAEVQDFIVEEAERLEALLPRMRRLRPKAVMRFRFA